MQIGHLALTYLDSGGWHGALCLELVLTGQLQASLMQICQVIDETQESFNIKYPKVICINGAALHNNDPQEVLELIQVLKGKGFTVVGKSDGTVYQRWFPELTHAIAVVRGPWLGYQCNEVQYQPAAEDALVEPRLWSHHGGAVKVIVLNNRRGLVELTDFNRHSIYNWGVLVPNKWNYNVILLGG